MLAIDISVVDSHGKRTFATVRATRGDKHTRLPNAFWYAYRANIDSKLYTGTVLHSYDNGGIALTVKITKSILMQQKAERAKK